MRVIALGVGGAFTDRFYHTNYLVEIPGCRLLIDAGTTLRYSLPAAGYTAKDISAVALTHFHSDHVGGLEEFCQRCRYLYQYSPVIYAKAYMVFTNTGPNYVVFDRLIICPANYC